MCGRYAIYNKSDSDSFRLYNHEIPFNFNVAPTSYVPIIRNDIASHQPTLFIARWGLLPDWAKDLNVPPFFNARSDKLKGNKVFWPSIQQRCIVPMSGFYEWSEHNKQPYYIYSENQKLIYAAGLWNRWQPKLGQSIESFTIITTKPNEVLADIHHRMPVVLDETNQQRWLNDDYEAAKELLIPYMGRLEKYPVNPRWVNNARNNFKECLEKFNSP